MGDIGHKLFVEIEAAKTLKAHLADLVPLDDETIRDSIEGETNLHEVMKDAVRQIGEDETRAEALKLYIDELSKRRERYLERAKSTRAAVAVAMEQAHLKNLETPYGTVTWKTLPPQLVIIDESQIPSGFWKPSDPRLDRHAVLASIKSGSPVPGAALSNGGATIAIKRL